jgi:hypothetical protein
VKGTNRPSYRRREELAVSEVWRGIRGVAISAMGGGTAPKVCSTGDAACASEGKNKGLL